MNHTVLPAKLPITPYLPLPPKRSPDGATTVVADILGAYYSFIDPKRMKG